MGWELWATLMDAHQTWQMLELSISSCYKGTGAQVSAVRTRETKQASERGEPD
jgi:hypothetical protein